MSEAIQHMLDRYRVQTRDEYLDALREILQQVALLGLWRGKFFEHAAFYGGTALRILYGLDRYSEDLDFSLLLYQSGGHAFGVRKQGKASDRWTKDTLSWLKQINVTH